MNADAEIDRALDIWKAPEHPLPEMFCRLCEFWQWLHADNATIRDANADAIPLRPNRTQRILMAVMLKQAYYARPIRVVVLKARKPGVSTFIQLLFAYNCFHYPNQVALMLADIAANTREIFEIARLACEEYAVESDVGIMQIKFPATGSRYSCHTAGSENYGAGGTPSMIHLSEMALWKAGTKPTTERTIMRSLPKLPNTIAVYESTARGRELFYTRFDNAVRDDDNLYAGVFIPWYFNELNQLDAPSDFARTVEEDAIALRAGRDGVTLTDDALQWRRTEIIESDEHSFRQEHPSTPAEAIQGRDDLVIPGLSDHILDELPVDPQSLPVIGGIDHGYNDPTAIVTGVEHDQTLYIVDVFNQAEALADDLVSELRSGGTYYCDPAALSARKELYAAAKRHGLRVRLNPAPRMKGETAASFVVEEWAMLAKMVRKGRVKILRSAASQLCLEADTLSYNPKTGTPDNKRGEGYNHFDTLDALRYLAMGISGRRKPGRPIAYEHRESRREQFRKV